MARPLKGFTLIELLVVIAILGVLISVVLASLNSARSKGNSAAVKANFDTIRAQANLYIDNEGSGVYFSTATPESSDGTHDACIVPGTVFTENNVALAIKAADKAAGGAENATPPEYVKCANDGDGTNQMREWAVWVPLVNEGTFWCMDSFGNAKEESVEPSGTTCL